MSALSKRVDKLGGVSDYLERPFVGIICKLDESVEDAIIRHGYDPEDNSVRFGVVRPVAAPPRGDA